MRAEPLLTPTDRGLYCPAGGFHIDPWKPVERAIVTHAHADHLHPTSRHILVARAGLHPTRVRADHTADIETAPYDSPITVGPVTVSLHPAGHVLGSAQLRLEHAGRVVVVSGDYKTPVLGRADIDPTCAPFEPVHCHTFITESTFGLPVFRWRDPWAVAADMLEWWRSCARDGLNAAVFTYALGKSQRLMRMLADLAGGTETPDFPGPILVHGALEAMNNAYRASGVALPPWEKVTVDSAKRHKGRALIIAPPSAAGTPWIRKLRPLSDASVSGWSQIRGTRRRRAIDRAFVISDHADWPGIIRAVRETGCESVGVTHGHTAPLIRYLRENESIDAWDLPTRWTGEDEERQEEHDQPTTTTLTREYDETTTEPSCPREHQAGLFDANNS